MMAVIWDIGRVVWLTLLLVAMVWIPAALSTRSRRPSLTIVFEHLVVIVMLAVIAVSLLSPAHLLNPLTLLVAYACWPLAQWLVRHRGRLAIDARARLQATVLQGATMLERAPDRRGMRTSIRSTARVRSAEFGAIAHSVATPAGLLIGVAVVIALAPAFAVALANIRLPNPQAYGELLTAQQLFAGELGWATPRVVPALTTAISVVSSLAPVHLIRLLVPIVGVVVFFSLITTVRVMTSSIIPAIIGTICATVLWSRSAQTLSNGLSAVFVLLAMLFWFQTLRGRRDNRWLAICASLLVMMLTPSWLLVVLMGAAMMLLAPGGALVGAGAAWIAVSSMAGGSSPMAWAVAAAGVAHLAVLHFRFARPPMRAGFAAAVAILGLAVVMPRAASAHYVEYDAAARAALDIANRFPKYRWMVVAPVEEWPLSYGRGWHMNLHEFVDELSVRINEEGYRLPYKVDELFVFVETRPFAAFDVEPADVPFETLVDPVYRHYRSLAGRSSLQFAAFKLCERLRERTPGASVYFDDGRLRVYRFTLR